MKEFFCLACDHVWHGLDSIHCPKCGAEDLIVEPLDTEDHDYYNNHYEGGFNYISDSED